MMTTNTLKYFIVTALCSFCFVLSAQKASTVMPLVEKSLLLSLTETSDALLSVGERGHILKSSDQGKTWRQIENVPVRTLLTDVTSIDQHVWAVGHDTTILYSSDGGESWEIQFSDPDREVPLLAIEFIDANKGFAVGAYGTLMKTVNGGKNWQDELISEELDYHLNDIVMLDEDRIYIAAEAGYAFKSEDGGASFQDLELPYPGSMFGVVTMGEQIITYGLRGHIQVSNDFAETWEEVDNSVLNNLFSATQVNANQLVLVGANGTRISLNTNDLSVVNIAAEDTGRDLADVKLVNEQLLIVGEEGFLKQALNK